MRCAERDGRRTPTGRRVTARDTSGALTDFDYDAWKDLARCYEFVPQARAYVEDLAADLGVSPEALAALEIGWDDVRKAWTVPERDHERRVVGVSLRHLTGEKTGFAGGHRGLILPHSLGSRPGPLHLAEGMTDTAALLSAGFAAAGRPQAKATGHVRVWATALAEDYARSGVVVVADADRAGIDGACDLATHLQTVLGTTVRVALPAGNYKDCREMFNSTGTITLITKED